MTVTVTDSGYVSLLGQSATITLGSPPPVILVDPGEINMSGQEVGIVVGTFVVGDPFGAPDPISGSGSDTYDMTGMTLETGEPATSNDRSYWLRYSATQAGNIALSATSADPFTMEIYSGSTLGTLTLLDAGPSFNEDINTGNTYIRLTNSDDTTIDVVWTFVPSDPQLLADPLTPVLDRTPNDLQVAVQGANAGETVRFTWSPPVSSLIPIGISRPITLANITADSEGSIFLGTLEIPAVNAGNYTVNIEGLTSGKLGSVQFQVNNDPLPQDSAAPAATPEIQDGSRWLWDDGTGHTWSMVNNPDRMKTVIVPKVLTPEHTTAGDGQHIVWQGAVPAVDWGFVGTVLTQEDYEEIEFFYGLDRRFYITTHRGDRYIVTFKSLEMVPHKAGDNFWAHDYTAELYLFPIDSIRKSKSFKWDTAEAEDG